MTREEAEKALEGNAERTEGQCHVVMDKEVADDKKQPEEAPGE